jgi:hypothetical protein
MNNVAEEAVGSAVAINNLRWQSGSSCCSVMWLRLAKMYIFVTQDMVELEKPFGDK